MSAGSKGYGNSKGKGKALVAQMGMFNNMADMEDAIYGDDDDDDLEAELLALAAEDEPSSRGSPKKGSPSKTSGNAATGLNVPQTGMKKIPSGLLELDRMVAESMKDLDDDVSDTEDPDLEAELMDLQDDDESYEPPAKTSPVAPPPSAPQSSAGGSIMTVLQERLTMYETAHSNALANGDTSKAKRLERGIKTLKDQTKKAKSGKPVPEDDIPPPVAAGAISKPATQQPAPQQMPTFEPTLTPSSKPVSPQPTVAKKPKPAPAAPAPYKPPENLSKEEAEKHRMLTERKDQFKSAALEAKHRGDGANASRYFKTYKQFENVIKAVENGQPIDLTQMPPPPPGFKAPQTTLTRESMQASAVTNEEEEATPTTSSEEKQKIYSAPQATGSLMEALEQRLQKYKEGEQKAKEEQNGSKARRMGRIVKQYQDAIKMSKAGKPYAFEDLPAPPGFPPLPVATQPAPAAAPKSAPVAPTPAAKPTTAATTSHLQSSQKPPAAKSPSKPLQRQMSAMSRAEQQAIFLQERQLQFKKAAFKAKQSGDIELAKKYLRQAKGFDQMIEASHSGLPVNLSNIPKPPGAEEVGNLEFVKEGENGKEGGDRDEMYKKLEQDLIQQIRTATTNAEHFTKLGDVSTASKFDKMSQSSRKDLDALKNAYKHGDPVPRFHYENRSFSMVQSCTDLGDNDLEICVVRGINYNLPSGYKENDLDTYIKYEFPFPKDQPQKGDSSTCKNTNCPEYDQSFKVTIERKSRVFSRILNSKTMKIDVYYKRGLFKGDKLLGSANIKLQPLENTCVLHESYDLMDGRKAVGGKLEVKLRVRNPFVGKQVEEVKEKWLIIDKFERSLPTTTAAKPVPAKSGKNDASAAPVPANMPDVSSMEVLKYEKQLLEQQIKRYQGKLKDSELDSFQHKVALIDKRIEQIRDQIKKTGVNGLRAYADTIEKSQNQYLLEAKAMVQQGNRDKAQILMTKKKLVEKEVEGIRSKIPRN